jgi:large subunit ribosomal protein L35
MLRVPLFVFQETQQGDTMPKMKTVRGAAKRFRATKNKIKRGSAFRSHILTKKPTKRMRGLKESQYVDSTNVNGVKLMLCQK